jgi:hypothetical protein
MYGAEGPGRRTNLALFEERERFHLAASVLPSHGAALCSSPCSSFAALCRSSSPWFCAVAEKKILGHFFAFGQPHTTKDTGHYLPTTNLRQDVALPLINLQNELHVNI